MKILVVLTLLLFMSYAHADRAKVLIVDPDIDSKDPKKDYDVQRPKLSNNLPDKDLRDKITSGIKSAQKWDELKKDIFYMDLNSKSLQDLKKKYPEITKQEFESIMERK